MKFERCLTVDPELLEQMVTKLQTCDPELPSDEAIFDQGLVISPGAGFSMMVQVITPNDPESEPCWSQAVLFDQDGRELACTEPSESLKGEWVIGYDCHEYHLVVVSRGQEEPEKEKMPFDPWDEDQATGKTLEVMSVMTEVLQQHGDSRAPNEGITEVSFDNDNDNKSGEMFLTFRGVTFVIRSGVVDIVVG